MWQRVKQSIRRIWRHERGGIADEVLVIGLVVAVAVAIITGITGALKTKGQDVQRTIQNTNVNVPTQ